MNVYQWLVFDFEEAGILKIRESTNEYANSWVNISQIIFATVCKDDSLVWRYLKRKKYV